MVVVLFIFNVVTGGVRGQTASIQCGLGSFYSTFLHWSKGFVFQGKGSIFTTEIRVL